MLRHSVCSSPSHQRAFCQKRRKASKLRLRSKPPGARSPVRSAFPLGHAVAEPERVAEAESLMRLICTGPLPRPTTRWHGTLGVVGRGSGPVPTQIKRNAPWRDKSIRNGVTSKLWSCRTGRATVSARRSVPAVSSGRLGSSAFPRLKRRLPERLNHRRPYMFR